MLLNFHLYSITAFGLLRLASLGRTVRFSRILSRCIIQPWHSLYSLRLAELIERIMIFVPFGVIDLAEILLFDDSQIDLF